MFQQRKKEDANGINQIISVFNYIYKYMILLFAFSVFIWGCLVVSVLLSFVNTTFDIDELDD
jgi:hypothetical protein